jgi:hypothetical protein
MHRIRWLCCCLYCVSEMMWEDEDVMAWIFGVLFPILICTEMYIQEYVSPDVERPPVVGLHLFREGVKCSILSSPLVFQSSCQWLWESSWDPSAISSCHHCNLVRYCVEVHNVDLWSSHLPKRIPITTQLGAMFYTSLSISHVSFPALCILR